MDTKLKVFLCHSSQDKPMVREVYRRLILDGFDVWLDEEKLLPGQDWNLEIEKAVEKTDAVIVFLSSNSINKEGYIQRELRFALDIALEKPEGSIFIIPIRLNECELPRRIRAFHYVNLFPESNKERAYKQIQNSLELRTQALDSSHSSSIQDENIQLNKSLPNLESSLKPSISKYKTHIVNPASLTQRQAEIAHLIAQGLTDNQISIKLDIPITTIKNHVKLLMEKLGCSSRSEIAIKYNETQLSNQSKNLYITSPNLQIEFIRIPSGNFTMGSELIRDANNGEQSQHTVFVSEFYISKSPITNLEYLAFIEATSHETPEHWNNKTIPQNKGQHPVVNVSWEDAFKFCEWLSHEINQLIRLPTEAEWEKASRGLDNRNYPWGNETPNEKLLNFNMHVGDTTPIKHYSPQGDGPFGLTDTCGNVWEWCLDWYQEDIYKKRKGTTKDPQGPKQGTSKVIRGGAFHENDYQVRCTTRDGYSPQLKYYDLGFRIVMTTNN